MKALQVAIFFAFVTTSAVIYQNCSPGFVVGGESFGESSLAESSDTEELLRAQGTSLYAAKCASCHGELSISSKANASVRSIREAIGQVAAMKALTLTDDEINAIQVALSPTASRDLRFVCRDANKRGLSNPAIRRMSALEVTNTLRSVLGPALFNRPEISELIEGLPADQVTTSIDEFSPIPQAAMQLALAGIANKVVSVTESDSSARGALFGACANANPVTDACASAFIASFASRSRRRPVSQEEAASLTKIFVEAGKGLKGLQSVLYVSLQAPELVMHIETGGAVEGARVRLTSYEIANRISYMISGSPPDAELLLAAEQDRLQTLAAIRTQVERLLNSSSTDAKTRVASFMKFYGGVASIEQPRPSVGIANGISTVGLDDQMIRELGDYSNYIFWQKSGNFELLMTSRDSFPRSDAMMTILGASAKVGANGLPVQASPAYPGFLHRPAFLASPSERTSPILRGVHIRREILCNEIPLPPSEDVDDKIEELGDIENQTNRARITQLTESTQCIGCHAQINPLGYLFERYDQLARPRTEEKIYDDKGVLQKSWSINSAVTNPKLDPSETGATSLEDSIALTNAIAKGKTARACFAQKAFEFVRARRFDPETDGCALREMEKKVQTGSLRDVLIDSIANEDIFWRSSQ